jgi:trigger factor
MQVSVESIGALGRRLKVAVPAAQLEKAYGDRLTRFSRQVKMPGFRPGKVPLKMVEQQYGGSLMEEVAGDLIQTSFQEAIGREGLRPAGNPAIKRETLTRGTDLTYTAEFEVYPQISKLDISGVGLERPVAAIAEEDIDRTLETIRKQRTTWNPVTRAAQNGDRVLIDFVGKLDGQPFEGGSATNFPVVLGNHTLIDDLETGLLGATAGEKRTVAAKFPDDYRATQLAGKTSEFDITVQQVTEPVVPAVDGELARQLGVADGDLAKLRAEVKANLERESASRTRAIVRGRVLQALLDGNRFEVPQGLVNSEVARLKYQDQTTRGATASDVAYQDRARRRVALGLILAEVIRARGLHADPAAIRQRLEVMAQEYEKPEEFVRWYSGNPERLAEIESAVLEDRIVEELLKGAALSDKPVSFQELLKLEAA